VSGAPVLASRSPASDAQFAQRVTASLSPMPAPKLSAPRGKGSSRASLSSAGAPPPPLACAGWWKAPTGCAAAPPASPARAGAP